MALELETSIDMKGVDRGGEGAGMGARKMSVRGQRANIERKRKGKDKQRNQGGKTVMKERRR